MNSEQKIAFEQALLKKKARIEKHIIDLKELTQPIAPENAIGRVSRMDAINNKSVNEAALRKSEEELKQMKSALKQINDVNFGKCKACGEEIPLGRLMLMPGSFKCVKCAR